MAGARVSQRASTTDAHQRTKLTETVLWLTAKRSAYPLKSGCVRHRRQVLDDPLDIGAIEYLDVSDESIDDVEDHHAWRHVRNDVEMFTYLTPSSLGF